MTFTVAPDTQIRLLLKRFVDIVLASLALILLSPLMLVIVICVKLTSNGPVVFKQKRCGLNGRSFTCYKFRSMVVDAEARKAEVMHLSCRSTATS